MIAFARRKKKYGSCPLGYITCRPGEVKPVNNYIIDVGLTSDINGAPMTAPLNVRSTFFRVASCVRAMLTVLDTSNDMAQAIELLSSTEVNSDRSKAYICV